MNPYQLIREAEIFRTVRENYEYSPTDEIPTPKEVRRAAGLRRISPHLEIYLDNLHDLQELLVDPQSLDVEEEASRFGAQPPERTHFGFLARCNEQDLYDEDANRKFSEFQEYQSCVLVVSPSVQGRLAVHWEYQDCSSPDECKRMLNPRFAREILHNRNYYYSDSACLMLQDSSETIGLDEKYELVLNALQNTLVANLATGGVGIENLIDQGYMPMRRMLRGFRKMHPDLEADLQDLDYVAEANVIEIHAASRVMLGELLVPIIANVPFNEIAEHLAEVISEYRELETDEFRKSLDETKRRMQKVERLFGDESAFKSFIKKLLS